MALAQAYNSVRRGLSMIAHGGNDWQGVDSEPTPDPGRKPPRPDVGLSKDVVDLFMRRFKDAQTAKTPHDRDPPADKQERRQGHEQ
jgi:hypothetical protein